MLQDKRKSYEFGMHLKLKASEKNLPNITVDIRYLAHYFFLKKKKKLYMIHNSLKTSMDIFIIMIVMLVNCMQTVF